MAAVVLILHCHFVWGRVVGLNARAFGFPLMISFMRYAVERRERPALAVLLAETFFYPSTFLICAPAYGLMLLWPWQLDRRWLRYGVVLAVGMVVLGVTALGVDKRIGHPIALEELMTLQQKAIVGTWPLQSASDVMEQSVRTPVRAECALRIRNVITRAIDDDKSGGSGGKGGGKHPVNVGPNDRLDLIAATELGDSGRWPEIAAFNDIVDPGNISGADGK